MQNIASRFFCEFQSTPTASIVEGKKFIVTYQVINNGDASASKIDIMDRYDPNRFAMFFNFYFAALLSIFL